MKKYKTLLLNEKDNVAVALTSIPKFTSITVEINNLIRSIRLIDNIEFGHKFAVSFITKGQEIKKYGEVIGIATEDIQPGQHVHEHNLVSKTIKGDGRK